MLWNISPTLEQFEAAQNYDFLKKKTADRLIAEEADEQARSDPNFNHNNSALVKWAMDYSITTRWAQPRQTISGQYVWPICPESDAIYETVEYSEDLFPVPAPIDFEV